MMKALVLRYEEVQAPHILRCYLNKRGRTPAFCDLLRITIEYPEPQVILKYCGGDVQVWLDTAIVPEKFSQTSAGRGQRSMNPGFTD